MNTDLTDSFQPQPMFSPQVWRAKAVLAFAYRLRGYLARNKGDFHSAEENYTKAANLWRSLDVRAELAETNNSLAFVLSELGEFSDAHSLLDDSIDIRRKLGFRLPVALSLNTQAHVYLREGTYQEAQKFAGRALALFRALESPEKPRNTGLALLALAEALRRQGSEEIARDPASRIELIQNAYKYSHEALQIFNKTDELARQVDALIEIGCDCRDWLKILQQVNNPQIKATVTELLNEGQSVLRKAADLATLYRKMDALVNLAWLGFYAGKEEILDQARLEVREAAKDYWDDIRAGRLAPDDTSKVKIVYSQIGKLHVLYGHRAFENFQDTKLQKSSIEKLLSESARYYTLGLAYSSLYGEGKDYRDLGRAKDQIYNNLRNLNVGELRPVRDAVLATENEWGLGESQMRRFMRKRTLWVGG